MKETVVSLNIFPGSVKTILVFSFRIAVGMQTFCLFFMLAAFLIRYIEKFQWAYMRNISIHLTSAVGDFCLMRVLRGYMILQVWESLSHG